jgi:hypothetical protein
LAGDAGYISAKEKIATAGNELWRGALALTVQAFEKKVHKHSSPEEFLKLAEVCLLEADRTLDREVADMLLLKAGRYLDEAKRVIATRRGAH